LRAAARAASSVPGVAGRSNLRPVPERGGEDDPYGAADEAGGEVRPVELERADDAHPCGIADVDLGDDRSHRHEGRADPHRAVGNGQDGDAGQHEQAIAVEQELVRPTPGEPERPEGPRPRAHVERAEAVADHDERLSAVRLHEVRLVDAVLLDVRAGVCVLRGLPGAVGDGGRRLSAAPPTGERDVEPVRADERQRVPRGVRAELRAPVERSETRYRRRRGVRGGPGHGGAADEDADRQDARESPHLVSMFLLRRGPRNESHKVLTSAAGEP
jgi:hypothetical protein